MKQCEKKPYSSHREAAEALDAIKSRVNNPKKKGARRPVCPKRAYKCDLCGDYHLASSKRKK